MSVGAPTGVTFLTEPPAAGGISAVWLHGLRKTVLGYPPRAVSVCARLPLREVAGHQATGVPRVDHREQRRTETDQDHRPAEREVVPGEVDRREEAEDEGHGHGGA